MFPTQFAAPQFSLQSENTPPPVTLDVGAALRFKSGGKAAKPSALERAIGTETAEFFEATTAAFKAESEAIVALGKQEIKTLYGFLERFFEFVRDKRFDSDKFTKYCRSKKLTCTKATQKNSFLCAIRATAPDIKGKDASKYAKALQWVETDLPEGWSVPQFLVEQGGIEACAAKARAAERRRNGLPPTGAVRRLEIKGVPEGLSGTVSLVVRIEGGKAEFVRHVPLDVEAVPSTASEDTEIPVALYGPDDPGAEGASENAQASAEAEEVWSDN